MSKSPYIEGSKHSEMTAAVEGHFFGDSQPNTRGAAPGGSSAWNPPRGTLEAGLNNNSPTGASGKSMWNAPGQSLPRETGVNYKPRANAGHSTEQDPFSLADGFPGN